MGDPDRRLGRKGQLAVLWVQGHRLRQISPLSIMGRWPCLCLLAWMSIPLLAIIVVVPTLTLTPPEKGWRVKDHEDAIAIDALELASREPSIAYELNAPPPSAPDCAAYLEAHGCGWTERWVCPDDYAGQGRVATNDGTDGFYCCCVAGGQPLTTRRLAGSAAAPATATATATVIPQINDQRRELELPVQPPAASLDWATEKLWLLFVARQGGNLLTEARLSSGSGGSDSSG